jgi:hypothetical protein
MCHNSIKGNRYGVFMAKVITRTRDSVSLYVHCVHCLEYRSTTYLEWGPNMLIKYCWFLRTFAKLWKATISFVMSVCPSSLNNSAPIRRIFMKFDISTFFKNLSRKFKFDLSLTRIKGTSHEDLSTFMIVYRWILLIMRNVSDKVVEKIKTHILCSITFFQTSCLL